MGIPVTDEDILRAFGLPGTDVMPFVTYLFRKSPKKLGIALYPAMVSIYTGLTQSKPDVYLNG
jgi:hypothetical protein